LAGRNDPCIIPGMIELSAISKSYSNAGDAAVTNLSLIVAEQEFIVLIGPSGCGKTTTLNMLNRLVEPDCGTIRLGGRDIRELDPVQLRRGIGYVFQEAGLFTNMSVSQNIAITPRRLGWTKEDITRRVAALLDLIRMPDFANREVRQLSGGQRQRVALARALAARPSVILLDEPFGALDPLTRDEISEEYRRIHKELGLTTIMVTHDMTEALLLADRIVVMRDGAVIQTDTPYDLVTRPVDDFVARLIETPKRRAAILAVALGMT
jgi:osmoprotectant transport system ATP-binding protein